MLLKTIFKAGIPNFRGLVSFDLTDREKSIESTELLLNSRVPLTQCLISYHFKLWFLSLTGFGAIQTSPFTIYKKKNKKKKELYPSPKGCFFFIFFLPILGN
jgi:hypothetical protein